MRGYRGSKYRADAHDIDGALEEWRGRVRHVALWREFKDARGRWKYLGRFDPFDLPYDSFIEFTQREFGGGHYVAKILGRWDRELRREEYLEQVSFRIWEDPTAGR